MSRNKLQEGDASFFPGQNSSLDPAQLPPNYYARGMNIVNRGGVLQCRPGYRCVFALPEGRLQGLARFQPKNGSPVLIAAVSGSVYVSEIPFKTYRKLDGIQFSPEARQIFFKQAEQTVQLNFDGSISFISPRNILIMQDGGFTLPAVFDGGTAAHTNTIPLGGPMEWSGDRLWVARGTLLFASDINNPLSFVETQYISGIQSFIFKEEITALAKNPSVQFGTLLVFTSSTTSMLQSGVRDRTQWINIQDFQREILPQVGCLSQRSVVAHYGLLWWFSQFGLTSLDAASSAYISSVLPYRDDEMQDSKSRLSSDLSGVACSTFENYLLCSVPYSDKFNRHTWCLDNLPLQTGKQEMPAWNSFWTGTRPVEWVSENFNGVNRIFYVSADFDGMNRLWEAFFPDRLDDGCPITWYAETRAHTLGFPGKNKEFRYADIFSCELAGVVDVAVFWAGGHRGKYKRILTKRINATTGIFAPGEEISMDSSIFALKKQSRMMRTEDGRAIISEETLSSCGVESPNQEFKDDTFQLLIVGSGPGAVRGYLIYAEPPVNDDDSGKCEKDETEENFVRFDGAASEATDFADALDEFDENIPVFRSLRTETVTQDGFTEIGVGEAQSVISQADADKIASAIALRKASKALESALPQIVSLGPIANEL